MINKLNIVTFEYIFSLLQVNTFMLLEKFTSIGFIDSHIFSIIFLSEFGKGCWMVNHKSSTPLQSSYLFGGMNAIELSQIVSLILQTEIGSWRQLNRFVSVDFLIDLSSFFCSFLQINKLKSRIRRQFGILQENWVEMGNLEIYHAFLQRQIRVLKIFEIYKLSSLKDLEFLCPLALIFTS